MTKVSIFRLFLLRNCMNYKMNVYTLTEIFEKGRLYLIVMTKRCRRDSQRRT